MRKLGNIARESITPSVAIDHFITTIRGKEVLIIYIPESSEKPVHLRGHSIEDSFIRSAGQTRKITNVELRKLLSKSSGVEFSSDVAIEGVSIDRLINLLDFTTYYSLIGSSIPSDALQTAGDLASEKLIERTGKHYSITNLGALLFAKTSEISIIWRVKQLVLLFIREKAGLKRLKNRKGKKDMQMVLPG